MEMNGNGSPSNGNGISLFDGLQSMTSERGVLGCIIQDSRVVIPHLEKSGVIAPWFYDLRHSRWFSLFRQMHHADELVDNITVASRLKTVRNPTELGGLDYFTELEASAPSAHNWAYYIPDLRDLFVRRKTIQAAYNAIQIAKDISAPFESVLSDLTASLESLSPSDDALPDFRDASELCDTAMPDPPELVHAVLHKETKFSIGGGSKTCKTWVLLDLALSISHGVKWLDFEVNQGPVLFVNLEIKEPFFRKRIIKVAESKGMTLESGKLDVWTLRSHSSPFHDILPRIQRKIQSRPYVLIILDPIYKIYGDLDENKAGDISRLMNALETLAFKSGAALGFAAHFTKGNQSQKEAIDRISGSGVFARDPDSILTMTAHEQKDAFTIDASLRNLPPINPFVVRWKYPLMVRDCSLDPTKLKNPKAKSQSQSKGERDTILKLIPESGTIAKQVLMSRAQSKGIGLNRCRGILSELLEEHAIHEHFLPKPKAKPTPAFSFTPPSVDDTITPHPLTS